MAGTVLTVCTTCRAGRPVEAEGDRPGKKLYDALAADLPDGVTIRPVECLSACDNGCSMVLSGGDQKWTYVYGHLTLEHAEDIIAGAKAYDATDDGLVPWRERPVIFRKQSLARIPPQETK
jgi:predicted metal-binding protein